MAFNKIIFKWGSKMGENIIQLQGYHKCYSPLSVSVVRNAFDLTDHQSDGNFFDFKFQCINMRKKSQNSPDEELKDPFERFVQQYYARKTFHKDNLCNRFNEGNFTLPRCGATQSMGSSTRYTVTTDVKFIKSKVWTIQYSVDLNRRVSTPTSAFQSGSVREHQSGRNLSSHGVNGCISRLARIQQQSSDTSKLLFRGFKTMAMPGFINPLTELQKYVDIPIIPPQEAVFSPTEEEVFQAAKIFTGSGDGLKVRFDGSFLNGEEMPESSVPEVAFLGRSNVGKSSLIRSMLGAHPDVNISVSKKPGHTKKLNLYRIGRHFTLVDMPGYGYNMPRTFEVSVEGYLNSRRRLCRSFLLVDAEVGLTRADNIALGMMREFGIPFVIVLTKIDKASRHIVLKNLLAAIEVCKDQVGHTCFSQPFLVSSRSGAGLLLLETFIAYVTGCVEIKGH